MRLRCAIREFDASRVFEASDTRRLEPCATRWRTLAVFYSVLHTTLFLIKLGERAVGPSVRKRDEKSLSDREQQALCLCT